MGIFNALAIPPTRANASPNCSTLVFEDAAPKAIASTTRTVSAVSILNAVSAFEAISAARARSKLPA